MKRIFYLVLLTPVFVFADPMYSPTWGFFLDLPEGYEYIEGDGKDRFSFSGPAGAMFDLVVYNGLFETIEDLIIDVNSKIENKGEADFFQYNDKQAAIIELDFRNFSGWGLCIELAPAGLSNSKPPLLLALSYGPADVDDLYLFHLSALDSICPSITEKYYPGPITEYSFPRGDIIPVTLAGGVNALIRENDAEAAQILIEREFQIMKIYAETPYWQEAWQRYYRFIYRDSVNRITNTVFALIRSWGGYSGGSNEAEMTFAKKALAYVQGFTYHRDTSGSDFLNLVSVITEGRGDCDSRAMLWAIILAHADIRAAIMVSPVYSHAMGLADIEGYGARFEAYGTKWLVAETTDNVDIGLIREDINDPQYWLGIIFE